MARNVRSRETRDPTPPFVDTLSLFGLLAVTAMLVTYAFEQRSHWFILAFAGACLWAALYGFMQGAWPFGIVEVVWSGVAVWRWRRTRTG